MLRTEFSQHKCNLTHVYVFNNTLVIPIHKTDTYILRGLRGKGGENFEGLKQGYEKKGSAKLFP